MSLLFLPDPLENIHSVGTKIADFGKTATIKIVDTDDDSVIYTLEYDDGDREQITGEEIELGLIDGTITVPA